MKNIKLYTLLESPLAVNEEKGAKIWNTILEKYKDPKTNLVIDFSDMRVIISPFMRSLLKPLYKKWIKFEWENFSNDRNKNIYKRVIEEFEKIWTDSIREINIK